MTITSLGTEWRWNWVSRRAWQIRLLLLSMLIGSSSVCFRSPAVDFRPPGYKPISPGVHALLAARVVPKPGEMIEPGIIVIRDGVIEMVGKEVAIPADARVWTLTNSTIYAGFIDAA